MSTPRVRIQTLVAKGQMLLGERVVAFELHIDGPMMSASFDEMPQDVSLWEAYGALERFVDLHLRG